MLALLLCLVSALAGDLTFNYTPAPGPGEQPAVMVNVPRQANEVLVIVYAGGQEYEFLERDVAGGKQLRFEWPRDTSVTTARLRVAAEFADMATEETVITLEYAYGGGLKVDLDSAWADVDKKVLGVEVTDYVQKAEIKAIGAHKELLSERTVEVNAGPGEIEVPWVGRPSEVVVLDVTLHNAGGWAGFTYSPWFLDIPHNDVLFETGQAVILPAEEPKLQETLEELQEVLDKYGSVVPVKLYIAGCTDTVGSAAANQELSRRRARSIAEWLRSHGYHMPIYYHGFGEDLPAVETPDETEESRNRRALYLVGANPPPKGSGIPSVRWSPL